MDQAEKRHNKGLEYIADRLLSKGYDIVLKHAEYKTPEYCGEIDILALRGSVLHFYEIKGNNCKTARKHASEQLKRVQLAFPNIDVKCIYVGLEGSDYRKVRRMY